jgi:hypothetical protein
MSQHSEKLTDGLHCKACNSPLDDVRGDKELCGECMGVVMDMNRDLLVIEEEQDAAPEDIAE